jgi:DNA (cytosine-5)-methyltransferase 1
VAKKKKNSPRKRARLGEDAPSYGAAENGEPLRFIDLFCGICGFRIGFERAGCPCVWSCDWNKYAQKTYNKNLGEYPCGDIHSVAVAHIPK